MKKIQKTINRFDFLIAKIAQKIENSYVNINSKKINN